MLSVAPTLPVTLHRAFDTVADPFAAIDEALGFPQIDRILTSGGEGDWAARCERFTQYAARAGSRLTFLPGGGVDEGALKVLAASGCVTEAHVGRVAREPQALGGPRLGRARRRSSGRDWRTLMRRSRTPCTGGARYPGHLRV